MVSDIPLRLLYMHTGEYLLYYGYSHSAFRNPENEKYVIVLLHISLRILQEKQ